MILVAMYSPGLGIQASVAYSYPLPSMGFLVDPQLTRPLPELIGHEGMPG